MVKKIYANLPFLLAAIGAILTAPEPLPTPTKSEIPKEIDSEVCFGWALEKMKKSDVRVRRKSWAHGVYLVMQRPDAKSKMTVPYVYHEIDAGCLQVYPGGARHPASLDSTDLLAEDWEAEHGGGTSGTHGNGSAGFVTMAVPTT